MNLQYEEVKCTRVLFVNPLTAASQLVIVKLLTGRILGRYCFLDLKLLVYSNEIEEAEAFKQELLSCAFRCINSIEVTSELPSISDADIFCFMTNFRNPNYLDIHDESRTQFDTLYLLIKIAHNFAVQAEIQEKIDKEVEDKEFEKGNQKKKKFEEETKRFKPIFVTDGLVALSILKIIAKKLPNEYLFGSCSLSSIARNILGDYLKVNCSRINKVYVWASSDDVFHIEVQRPTIIDDTVEMDITGYNCDWYAMSKEMTETLRVDQTQFSRSWLKKEFLEKVRVASSKNPYGYIYKASEFTQTLKDLWRARCGETVITNLGIISDGSGELHKGCAYVLPLKLTGETYELHLPFATNLDHVIMMKQMTRIHKMAGHIHNELVPFLKQFLKNNVIELKFAQRSTTGSDFSLPDSAKEECECHEQIPEEPQICRLIDWDRRL